jgi:hypothetical protein
MGVSKFSKLKTFISLLLIALITAAIISQLGFKIEQQHKLYNRSELEKLDASLRELGVEVCIIQPASFARGDFIVMISFWEKNHQDIQERMSKIKAAVVEYARRSDDDIRSPVIEYYDSDGFILEDTLRAMSQAEIDETQPEYFDVIVRFTRDLKDRLNRNFSEHMEQTNFDTKIIADVKYDVTLDAYSPKQIFFYARFNNANTEQLKSIRIQYKRISGFNETRGDVIHFYNLNNREYAVVESLIRKMNEIKKDQTAELRNRTVFYDPLKFSGRGWRDKFYEGN